MLARSFFKKVLASMEAFRRNKQVVCSASMPPAGATIKKASWKQRVRCGVQHVYKFNTYKLYKYNVSSSTRSVVVKHH